MVGIKRFGIHVPVYRLDANEISMFWHKRPSRAGKKAVAGFDEDCITMATSAVIDCYKNVQSCVNDGIDKIDLFCLSTTCSPYKEKQSAAIVAKACGVRENALVVEFSGSLRSGSIALRLIGAALASGYFNEAVIVSSECRRGIPGSELEQTLGDGAVAFVLSRSEGESLAVLEQVVSVYKSSTDFWRKDGDRYVRKTEQRFIDEAVFMPIMEKTIKELLEGGRFTPDDFSKVVIYGYSERVVNKLAQKIGFRSFQLEDNMFRETGNMGIPSAFLMLCCALSSSKPGDLILFATYGDGADAYVLRTTERVRELSREGILRKLVNTIDISYADYLKWHDIMEVELPNLAPRLRPSVIAQWRRSEAVLALEGVKCIKCGTPQYSPIGQAIRVCVKCQAKDSFEPYRFSDKKGVLFTYSLDFLQTGKNFPGVNGVIDFEDGGRLVCELTDCLPEQVQPGIAVEMTLRRFSEYETITYFWKARPVRF